MKRLKIHNLITQQINAKSMKMFKGGEQTVGCSNCCVCGCVGPSNNSSNGNANHTAGKYTVSGGTLYGNCS